MAFCLQTYDEITETFSLAHDMLRLSCILKQMLKLNILIILNICMNITELSQERLVKQHLPVHHFLPQGWGFVTSWELSFGGKFLLLFRPM